MDEEPSSFLDRSSVRWQFSPSMGPIGRPINTYAEVIDNYTKRALSNQSDALDAMAGVISRFSYSMRCRFLQGIPTATFDLFLLFTTNGSSLRRRQGFPSYSWLDGLEPKLITWVAFSRTQTVRGRA